LRLSRYLKGKTLLGVINEAFGKKHEMTCRTKAKGFAENKKQSIMT